MALLWQMIMFLVIFSRCSSANFKDYFDVDKLLENSTDEEPVTIETEPPLKPCNDNTLMLHLGQLYISSPERVVYLLTTAPVDEVCEDVNTVLAQLHDSMQNCWISEENLYKKLTNGLIFFNSTVCEVAEKSTVKREIEGFEACLQELREEFLECEGPADWFESNDSSVICNNINEISDCLYVKTAILCGPVPARTIRNFSADVMNEVTKEDCRIPKHVSAMHNELLARYAIASDPRDSCLLVYALSLLLTFVI